MPMRTGVVIRSPERGFAPFESGVPARLAKKSAGQGNALPFARGQSVAPLSDDGVVAFGERGDERINRGVASAGADLVQSGPRLSVGDVFADGGAEEIGSLLDESDFTAKIAESQRSNVVAVDG